MSCTSVIRIGGKMGRTRLQGIEIAGVRIAVEIPSALRDRADLGAGAHFECSPVDPDLRVGVRIAQGALPDCDPVVYASGGSTFEVGELQGEWWIAIHGRSRYERVARFDAEFREGEVWIAPALAREGLHPLAHPLDELVLLHRIARQGGLVVHGSAVLREGRALVFVGQDPIPAEVPDGGAWRRWQGRRLEGDRVVMRLSEDHACVRVHSVPWQSGGGLASSASARIDAIHAIETSPAIFASRVVGDGAVTQLLSHVLAPVHDPQSASALLETASRVAALVPLLRLGLPAERRVVPFTWGQRHAALAFAPPFVS